MHARSDLRAIKYESDSFVTAASNMDVGYWYNSFTFTLCSKYAVK